MPNTPTDYSLYLYIKPQRPQSTRKPGHQLLSYQWMGVATAEPYSGFMPIPLNQQNFQFAILDYTKTLQSPTVKIEFLKIQGSAHSPVDAAATTNLHNGVTSTGKVEWEEFNLFEFASVPMTNSGNGFSFSVDIDDPSNPQDKWFIDPQMIVEEG